MTHLSLLLLAMLLVASPIRTEAACRDAHSSKLDTINCDDAILKSLDATLNNTYAIAYRAALNRRSFSAAQKKWLRSLGNQCSDNPCLAQALSKRIAEINDQYLSSLQVTESPLQSEQAKTVCTSLAQIADHNGLDEFATPGIDQVAREDWAVTTGWAISEEERTELKSRHPHWLGDANNIFRLRLSTNGPPIKFARFWGGGTCASYQIYSIPQLMNSNDGDVGWDEVDDPSDELRWAHSGNGDYPIFYQNRNFLITADLPHPNRIKMISWIKPDGRIRPLCLLTSEIAKVTVTSSSKHKLCSSIAAGTLPKLEWPWVTKKLPIDHESGRYRDNFVERYGEYADAVGVNQIDLDEDGSPETIGLFSYASGAGCGSDQSWLRVLSDDLGNVVKNDLNTQLSNLNNQSGMLYERRGRYYVATTEFGQLKGAVQFVKGKTKQVCEFSNETRTTISAFFKTQP